MSVRSSLALAAVTATALTIAIGAPVVRHPRTLTVGAELVGRHHDPFTVMQQYGEGRVPAPYLQPATDLSGMVLARFIGGIAAYNWLVLLAFPLTAITAYAHARHLIGPGTGAIVAALLFAFSPFHIAQAAYHVHIAQIEWIPLFFLTLWRLLDRPSAWRGAALVVAFLLVALASFYLGFIAAVVAPVAALAYAWWSPADGTRRSTALAWIGAAIASAAILLALAAWIAAPQLRVLRAQFGFPEEAAAAHSARWWSYLAPPLAHPWLARITPDGWRPGNDDGPLEQQLSLGWSVMALAAVPLVAWGLRNRGRGAATAPALAVIAAFALICSLTPGSRFLHVVSPMLRAYARFGVIVSLMVTTLAGAGVAWLLEAGPAARMVAFAALAIAAFEYTPSLPQSRDVLPTAGHRWIADRTPRDARVLDCITPEAGSTGGVRWLMQRDVAWLEEPFDDCGEPAMGQKLADLGFTQMIVRRESSDAAWAAAGAARDGLRLAARFDDAWVFDVDSPRSPLFVSRLAGFFPREYLALDSWRWMASTGSVTFTNVTGTTVVASLDLELASFAVARRITLSVDGVELGILPVGSRLSWYSTPAFEIAPGTHVMSWTPDIPPTPARVAAGTSDGRTLSVALHRWRWRVS